MNKKIWLMAGLGATMVAAVPVSRVVAGAFDEYAPQKLTTLRDMGPQGLAQLVAAHQSELDENTLHPPKDDTQWKQLCAALDEVGGAKDNYAARLYWFTDLEKAKAAAKAQNKPILSLRLLGKLTDELSCANSRFFRTALYPNAKINPILRDDFILFWGSERPVPVVTIDMGDGRKIQRTLTGNSAHYLLDSEGAPLDVLPGLNAPGAFQKWLESSEKLFADYSVKPENQRADFLADYHEKALETAILQANPSAKNSLNAYVQSFHRNNPLLAEQAPAPRIAAEVAAPMPVSKIAVESSLLSGSRLASSSALDANLSRYEVGMAAPYLQDAKLDANSLALMRAKNPPLEKAASKTDKAQVQNINTYAVNSVRSTGVLNPEFWQRGADETTPPFERLVQNFERALAFDTARNAQMHQSIHALFADGKQGDFDSLNRKIYDRLFLTPRSDEWLGLDTPGIYTAIDNGGILQK